MFRSPVRPLVLVATLCLAAPAAAIPAGPDAGREVALVRALTADARATANALRAAGASGSVEAVLREALGAGGAATAATPPDPGRLDPSVARALAGLPLALALPLADLAATVAAAERAVRHATEGVDPDDAARALASLAEVGLEVALPMTDPLRPPGPGDARRALGETARRWERRAEAVDAAVGPVLRAVDRQAIHGAALALAASVDRVLPALSAAAVSIPPPPGVVDGCDVLDLTPFLCVGGTGDNIHEEDQVLLVDLGGDDVYRNAAGGVNPVDASVGGPAVSLNLDLGGDDVYDHVTGANRPQPAQGAAVVGIGMLVDAGGHDTYHHRVLPTAEPDPIDAFARAQGVGALGGVGILADLGGNDTYVVETTAIGPERGAQPSGQGLGIAGVGVLLDAGRGDDAYRVSGGMAGMAPPGPFGVSGARRPVAGQGVGSLAGTGVLVDGGGTDELVLEATSQTPPGFTHYEDFDFPGAPRVELRGQGSGAFEGGAGILVTGAGPTTYSMVAEGAGLGSHGVLGQALGLGGGTGILDDGGGDDRYAMGSRMEASLRVEADGAEAELRGFSPVATQNVLGQGFAFHGLAGQPAYGGVVSRGGNDRYLALHEGSVTAEAVATGEGETASATAVSLDAGPLWVQGSAVDSSVGVLLNESGDDEYVARLHQTARAEAEADDPDDAESLAVATPLGLGFVDAQGATSNSAEGILADLGGRDRYEARAVTRAAASPTPGGAVEVGGMAIFQGSGPNALLLDLDSGEQDAFVSEPNFEDTCVGHRGEPTVWSECPVGQSERPDPVWPRYRPLGTGVVDSAPVKGPTATVFDEEQEPTGESGGLLTVGGVLRGPDGGPLAGEGVQVRAQWLEDSSLGGLGLDPTTVRAWWDLTAVHAVTDEVGRWEAILRLPDPQDLPGPFRLWAGYSGTEALRGSSDAVPLTLE